MALLSSASLLPWALVAAVLSWVSSSAAQTHAAPGGAGEPCARFVDELRAAPGPEPLVALAGCREHHGRLADAWTLYARATEQAQLQGKADVAQAAQQASQRISPKLGRVRLVVGSGYEALSFAIDGVALSLSEVTLPRPLDPGVHTITASRPGFVTWSHAIDVGAGAEVSVTVPTLVPLPASVAAVPPMSPQDVEAAQRAARIGVLRGEIVKLEHAREEASYTGPIWMLAIGGGVAIAGVVSLVQATTGTGQGGGGISGTSGGLSAALLVGGVALGTVGGIMLGRRVKKREVLDKLIDRRVEELDRLEGSVAWLSFDPIGGRVLVSGSF